MGFGIPERTGNKTPRVSPGGKSPRRPPFHFYCEPDELACFGPYAIRRPRPGDFLPPDNKAAHKLRALNDFLPRALRQRTTTPRGEPRDESERNTGPRNFQEVQRREGGQLARRPHTRGAQLEPLNGNRDAKRTRRKGHTRARRERAASALNEERFNRPPRSDTTRGPRRVRKGKKKKARPFSKSLLPREESGRPPRGLEEPEQRDVSITVHVRANSCPPHAYHFQRSGPRRHPAAESVTVYQQPHALHPREANMAAPHYQHTTNNALRQYYNTRTHTPWGKSKSAAERGSPALAEARTPRRLRSPACASSHYGHHLRLVAISQFEQEGSLTISLLLPRLVRVLCCPRRRDARLRTRLMQQTTAGSSALFPPTPLPSRLAHDAWESPGPPPPNV